MKHLGKDLFGFAIALLFCVLAIQFVWSLMMEFKSAIVIGLLIICLSYVAVVIRRYKNVKKDDDNLSLGGWD